MGDKVKVVVEPYVTYADKCKARDEKGEILPKETVSTNTDATFSLSFLRKRIQSTFMEGRLLQVENALKPFHLLIRDDSRLVYNWCIGNLSAQWSLERIVHELCLVHYLYNFTPYAARLRQTLPWVKWQLRTLHQFNEAQLFDHVQTYIIPAIRLQTLMETGGLPKQWPWLES